MGNICLLQETVATKNSVKDSSIRRKESGLAAIKWAIKPHVKLLSTPKSD